TIIIPFYKNDFILLSCSKCAYSASKSIRSQGGEDGTVCVYYRQQSERIDLEMYTSIYCRQASLAFA
ncbi:MAG: hypothetical protein WCJ49_02130, partial [Deltaproteobacteria bacterium]